VYQILAADIGGTHSRVGIFEFEPHMDEPRLTHHVVRLPTAESESFSGLLARFFSEHPSISAASCDLAILAVAGPVQGRFCNPPNIKWTIDLHDIANVGLRRGALMNDFAAQAYACRSHAMREAKVLQPSRADHAATGGTVAVIGAGTGLGHCALVAEAEGYLAVPSEAGHAAFPFVGEEECAYGEYVRRVAKLPYCHGDAIVSGSGLARLHAFLTGEELSPANVAARLADSPRTAEWFARFYGRAARNYALNILALGGVFVTGGVAARNALLVEHPAFLAEFRSSPAHGALLAGIPVSLNRNEDAGVYGAAFFGAQRLRRRG